MPLAVNKDKSTGNRQVGSTFFSVNAVCINSYFAGGEGYSDNLIYGFIHGLS